MRKQLLSELKSILPAVKHTQMPQEGDPERAASLYCGLKEEHVVKASSLLRLYCALMGIAGLKCVDNSFLFLSFNWFCYSLVLICILLPNSVFM